VPVEGIAARVKPFPDPFDVHMVPAFGAAK
jgi:hypothetical protein